MIYSLHYRSVCSGHVRVYQAGAIEGHEEDGNYFRNATSDTAVSPVGNKLAQISTASGQHRTLNNAVFNTLPWAVSAILGLVFTPYIVHGFGAEAYGVLSVVLAIVGYLSFLDLNLDSAVVKYVAEYQGEGSVAKVNEVIGITICLFLTIGITGGLALLLSADLILTRFLKIDPNLITTARSAISIGAVGFLAGLFLSAVTGVVNGLNRFEITSGVKVVSSILISLGTVSLVKFGFGFEWVVALNVATSLLGFGILLCASKSLLPGISFKPVRSGKMTRTILRFGGYTFLGRLSHLIHFQADKVIAAVLLGSSAVTFYAVPSMLVQRIMDVITRLAYVTYPLVSELQGRKNLERIKDVYRDASRITLVLATAILLPVLIFGNKFFAAWMGPEFERNTGFVLQLSTVAFYLITLTNVPSLVLNGLGHVRITGLFSMTGGVLYLALIYPLTTVMGVSGIAASLLISRIVMVPIFLTYANRKVMGLPMVELLKDVYARPVILAVCVAGAARGLPLAGIQNIFLLIGAMALTGVIYLTFAISIGVFNREERQVVISYLHGLTRTN